MRAGLYFSTGKDGIAIWKQRSPYNESLDAFFVQSGVFMGMLVTSVLVCTGNWVTAVHLCFFSTEMEYPVDCTCKQCQRTKFSREQGKELCWSIQYNWILSSGAAADLYPAPRKYPLFRGEWQEDLSKLAEGFGKIKWFLSTPCLYVNSTWVT